MMMINQVLFHVVFPIKAMFTDTPTAFSGTIDFFLSRNRIMLFHMAF